MLSESTWLETLPPHDLQKSDRREGASSAGIPFTGTPRRHPYDSERLLLVATPFSSPGILYEFRIRDILAVEEEPNLVTADGESIRMVRIWVRRGSLGLLMQPFEVRAQQTPSPWQVADGS